MTLLPRKETISSRIVAALRAAILRGDLKPGAKINLDRLRQDFAISISPLREAVSRLVPDGLVKFEDQRGYRVAPVSATNLAEITDLRAGLEVQALRAAIAGGDLDWEADVLRALHRLNHTARDPASPVGIDAWEALHEGFHLALISGCRQPLLMHFCTVLRAMNGRYRRLLPGHSPGRDSAAEHAAIAQAATAHHTDAACAALHDHITRTGRDLAARLRAQA